MMPTAAAIILHLGRFIWDAAASDIPSRLGAMPRRPPSATGGHIPNKKRWGASRGGRGTLWDLTPGGAQGIGITDAPSDRLHGRIPQAGPCSTFADPLFRPSALTWDAS